MKKLLTLLLVIISIAAFAQGNKVTSVNPGATAGSRSLTGSYVAFDPSVGGELGYIAGGTQDLVFRTESYTPDWEYVYNLWLEFPDGWVVNSVSIFGTPTCTGGGSLGSFSFTLLDPPNAVNIYHPRYQAYTDHCTVYYMVNVTAGSSAGTAEVSWYWDGDGYNYTPHNPCSTDGYTPAGQNPCDEMINPQAMVPQYYASLDCPQNAIFSQPPFGSDNAYFSDESTSWGDQRVFENFSGVIGPIGGITYWGVLYANGECYTGAADDFVVTFFQDNAGAVGAQLQSFSVTVTPSVTGLTISGARVLRYDVSLPSNVSLADGWVMVYRENPGNTLCAFAWARTNNGDNVSGWNQSGGTIFYQSDNVAFCLTAPTESVPLSNWALFTAIGLILIAAVIRFRRLI
jgi:hypothetical protein